MVKINKILTTGLLGATLALGITGCGGTPIPPKQMKSAYNGVSVHLCCLRSDSLRRDILCNNILA